MTIGPGQQTLVKLDISLLAILAHEVNGATRAVIRYHPAVVALVAREDHRSRRDGWQVRGGLCIDLRLQHFTFPLGEDLGGDGLGDRLTYGVFPVRCDDIADVGFSVVWPQLPLFDQVELARRCRELGLVVELHPERGDLMQNGTPAQVRDYMLRLVENFGVMDGGSWLYLETDPNFPWKNIEEMFGVAMELRSG